MTQPQSTRRWVLQLAGGAVLTGFSGALDLAAEPLPAGLYLPSPDHIAHVLKAAVSAHPFAGYSPQFFSPDQFKTVLRIVAVLLGDIPNGSDVVLEIVSWIDLTVYDASAVRAAANGLTRPERAVAIAYFGEGPVRELETSDPQEVCRRGLDALAQHGEASSDQGLHSLLVHNLDRQQRAGDDVLPAFFSFLKKRAFEGYYTSREGMRELDYKGNSFYAESPGCTHRPGSHF